MRLGTLKETMDGYYYDVFWLVFTGTYLFVAILEDFTFGIVAHAILFGAFLNVVAYKKLTRTQRRGERILTTSLNKMFEINDSLLENQITLAEELEAEKAKNNG